VQEPRAGRSDAEEGLGFAVLVGAACIRLTIAARLGRVRRARRCPAAPAELAMASQLSRAGRPYFLKPCANGSVTCSSDLWRGSSMWSARQERSRFGCVVNGRRDFLVCWSGAMRRGTRADDARDGSRTGA
jgi:hypothetical protein